MRIRNATQRIQPHPVLGDNVKRWLALIAAAATWACSADSGKQQSGDTTKPAAATSTGGGADLIGAGATFPYPIYTRWVNEYAAKSGVKINYQSIGSGGGIRQFTEGTVDFGASDAPMSDEEMSKLKAPAYHIPTVIGVIAIAYNVPGVTQPLKLTGQLVADIFLGKITKWNDPRIVALNADAKLPASDILVVHRSEGSGTTYIFSEYLSAVSPAWKSGPGKGKELQWPVGLGAKGNESVTGQVKQTPGAVGYIELAYARQSKLPTALLQNAAGQFVAPTADAATAAAEQTVAKLPANSDYRVSIVNSPGPAAYPIASFTWLLVSAQQTNPKKAKSLADFLRWALTDGQKEVTTLDYAPLPASLVTRLMPRIDSIAPPGAAR
jgi:phosphate transport system substrate-binding protein